MVIPLKFVLIAAVAACLVFAACLAYHETRVPQNQGEVLNRMIELEREGRYDKAVQIVQTWMTDSRRDISHDDFLCQQIAMVYIARAYKKTRSRDESVHLAEINLEKALGIISKNKSEDLDIMLFEVGGAYELLGDVSDKDKCRLYEKARELFVQQLPLIKGDSYTAYGHTTPLEPVRRDVRKHLNTTTEKSSRAGCTIPSEK
jgi:tetratricopeptide (TPR) repeat protein